MGYHDDQATIRAKRIAEMKSFWQAGMTSSEIAARLGISRNAVIGLFTRHPKQCHPCILSSTKGVRKEIKRRPKASRSTNAYVVKPLKEKIKPKYVPREPITEANPLHIDLVDLKSNSCRFPYGEKTPYTFCGQHAEKGSSYCEAHNHFLRPSQNQHASIERWAAKKKRDKELREEIKRNM